jgi:hypothetical protein
MWQRCRFTALMTHFRAQRPSFLAAFRRSRRVSGHSGRAAGGLRPEKKLQPPHVVSQIHQSDLHRRPNFTLGSHQDVALTCALITEDMFDAGANLRAPVVGRLVAYRYLGTQVHDDQVVIYPVHDAIRNMVVDGSRLL